MIEPVRCSVITGATARIPRNTPTRLTSMTRRKSSTEVSANGCGEEHAGVVEQDVDAPVRLECAGGHRLPLRLAGHVVGTRHRTLAQLARELRAPAASASVRISNAPSSAKRRAAAAPMPPAEPVTDRDLALQPWRGHLATINEAAAAQAPGLDRFAPALEAGGNECYIVY